MVTKIGSGKFTYEVLVDWAKLPEGWSFVEATDVAVDSRDRVYLLTRGEHPVIVFDPDGNVLSSWGEGILKGPHGVTIGPDDSLYCADDADHTVRKFTPDGKVLMTIGTSGQSALFQGGLPFNRPTKAALDPKTGGIYVADGYGNSRVHKYSPEGKLLFSWGEPGTDPGEFNVVHGVCTDKEGHVYIADRENHRIQIFDAKGKYVTQWNNMHRPCGLYLSSNGEQLCYVGGLGPSLPINKDFPKLGPRIDIYNLKGERLARLGDVRMGGEPHQFWAPHGIAKDSKGNIYVAEVSWSFIGSKMDPPKKLRCFRKLVKVG